jgi:hypothetical protein
MKELAGKSYKGQSLFTTVAESIGTTMGAIVSSANAAQKALTKGPAIRSVKRNATKLKGKAKKAGRNARAKL